MTQVLIMTAIVIYLLGMLAVGVVYSKKNNSVDDFYLGGRKLGPFVTAMSAEASDMSSWLLMGLPGVAYLTGMAEASWTAIGLAVGTWLNWLIVAKRIRRYSQKLDAITIPQFFSKRWGDDKYMLSAMSAIDPSIYECAELDGANGFQRATRITLPLIWNTFKIVVILVASGTMKIYDHIIALTGGGPGRSSMSMAVYAYQNTFKFQKFGYGSAISIMILVIAGGIGLLVQMIMRREDA